MANNIDLELIKLLSKDDIKLLINSIDMDKLMQPFKQNSKKYAKYMSKLGNLKKNSVLASKFLPGIVFELYERSDYGILVMLSVNANIFKKMFVSGLEEKNISLTDFSEQSPKEIVNFLVRYDSEINSSVELPLFLLQLKMNGIVFKNEKISKIEKIWNEYKEKSKAVEKQKKEDIYKLQIKNLTKEYDLKMFKIETEKKQIETDNKLKDFKIKKLENSIQQLESVVEIKEKECKNKQDLINVHKKKIDELNHELKDIEKKVANDEKQFKEEWIHSLNQEHKILIEQDEELAKSIKDTSDKVNTLSEEYQEKLKFFDELEKEIQLYSSELVNIKAEVDVWKEEREGLNRNTKNKTVSEFNSQETSSYMAVSSGNALYIETGVNKVATKRIDKLEKYKILVETNIAQINCRMEDGGLEDFFNSAIGVNLIPTLCGYGARKAAMALISARYGEIPTIISIPAGYSDIDRLSLEINRAGTEVIIIEDLFGKMNEDLILPVLRKGIDKQLVFCCESMDCIKYVAQYFYNYIQIIQLRNIKNRKIKQLTYVDARDVFNIFDINEKTEYHKLVKRVLKDTRIEDSFISSRGDLLTYANEIMKRNKEDIIKFWFENELKYILNEMQLEQVKENLQNASLGLSAEIIGIMINER